MNELKEILRESISIIDKFELNADDGDLKGVVFDLNEIIKGVGNLCGKPKPDKPVLRMVHHLACTGGTLISKCLAALPNVHLLSEVHPLTVLNISQKKPSYTPSDITKLSYYAQIPRYEELAAKIFKASIHEVLQHLDSLGGALVLRDHSHSDFCLGQAPNGAGGVVRNTLCSDYEVRSLVTIRNPIDSYLSLKLNGWIHFSPSTFDEYCSRYISFLKEYETAHVVRYEDFVGAPMQVMREICSYLDLPFNSYFERVFDLALVSGDSGRSGAYINARERRDFPVSFHDEVQNSKNYQKICDLGWYLSSRDSQDK